MFYIVVGSGKSRELSWYFEWRNKTTFIQAHLALPIHRSLRKSKPSMLTDINPKLPMRHKSITRDFYLNKLGFKEFGRADFEGYLMLEKDRIQIHFFEFKELDPKENYGQVYIRTDNIDHFYQSLLAKRTSIHPNGHLEIKPWGQKEFSILDPDNNLLTFGQSLSE